MKALATRRAREVQVPRLVAEELTNQETAQRLFVTLPTVKPHTVSISGQLGVRSRGEAVARARTLDLLSPAEPSAANACPARRLHLPPAKQDHTAIILRG